MTEDIIQIKNSIKEHLSSLNDCFDCEDYLSAYQHAEFIKQALDDICYIEDSMVINFINKKI